jgi:hypothetical protein
MGTHLTTPLSDTYHTEPLNGTTGKAYDMRTSDGHRGKQVNFRVYDPRLLRAVAAFQRRGRLFRNAALTRLLQRALEAEGLWPPPEPPRPG